MTIVMTRVISIVTVTFFLMTRVIVTVNRWSSSKVTVMKNIHIVTIVIV